MKTLETTDGRHKVYFADSRRMDNVASESVDLVITSPPYYLGMDYGNTPGQLERVSKSLADYKDYTRSLEPVWRECYRVMKPGAYACINAPPTHTDSAIFGDSFILPLSEDVAAFWRNDLGATYKARYAWIAKRSVRNSNKEPFRFLGSYPLPLEGCVVRDVEDIIVLRKPRGEGYKLTEERTARRRQSALNGTEGWLDVFGQIWTFPGAHKETTNGVIHPAPFPLELPRRCILGYSVIDDVILDPFLGTGTTTLAAMKTGRKSIGYELEERFAPHIEAKCGIRNAPLATMW